jgi:peptidoglycan/LPS O-acetylase OafA/YrhL
MLLWARRPRLLQTLVALTALSFAADILFFTKYPQSTFYLPYARFWELLLGCLVGHSTVFHGGPIDDLSSRWHRLAGISTRVSNAVGAIGILLIALAVAVCDKNRAFSGPWLLLPTVGSAFLIAAGPRAWVNRAVLGSRALVFIGLISYPLYLWHWPLLSFAGIVATPTITLRLILILVSILLAWATWKYVEQRIRTGGTRSDSRHVVTILCVLSASLHEIHPA